MSAVSMVTLKGQDEKVAPGTFTILQILYTPSILHLTLTHHNPCLLYTSDAADDESIV